MDKMYTIKKIVSESGNNFHCKVLKHLQEKQWFTLVSPYYTDFVTDKPREIDIIAEKEFVTGEFTKKTINVKLYIECKYVSKEMVFWFSNKDIFHSREWVSKHTPIEERNAAFNNHHYIAEKNSKVAKLFSSGANKQSENEAIYKALNQCLNALVYHKRSYSIIPNRKKYPVFNYVHYPLIIYNSFDKLFGVEMDGNNEPYSIQDNFQFEINYAYLDKNKNSKTEYFLIDFVEINQLDKFLTEIEKDVDGISTYSYL